MYGFFSPFVQHTYQKAVCYCNKKKQNHLIAIGNISCYNFNSMKGVQD